MELCNWSLIIKFHLLGDREDRIRRETQRMKRERRTTNPWVTMIDAQEILHASRETVLRLIHDGSVGVYQLPGAPPRLSRAEVLALATRAFRPATAS